MESGAGGGTHGLLEASNSRNSVLGDDTSYVSLSINMETVDYGTSSQDRDLRFFFPQGTSSTSSKSSEKEHEEHVQNEGQEHQREGFAAYSPPLSPNSTVMVQRRSKKKSAKYEILMLILITLGILFMSAMSLLSVIYIIPNNVGLSADNALLFKVICGVIDGYGCFMALYCYISTCLYGKLGRRRGISSINTGLPPSADGTQTILEEHYIPYCYHCGRMRYVRTHHCSLCGVCTSKYDHHCSYIGSCVGQHNLARFYRLLVHSVLSSFTASMCSGGGCVVAALCAQKIKHNSLYNNNGISSNFTICIILAVFTGISTLLGLLVFFFQAYTLHQHHLLICTGTTLIEFDLLQDLYIEKRRHRTEKMKRRGLQQHKYKDDPSFKDILQLSPFRKDEQGHVLSHSEHMYEVFGHCYILKLFLPLPIKPGVTKFDHWEYLRYKLDIRLIGKHNR